MCTMIKVNKYTVKQRVSHVLQITFHNNTNSYTNFTVYLYTDFTVYSYTHFTVYSYTDFTVYSYIDFTVYSYYDFTVYSYYDFTVYSYTDFTVYSYTDFTVYSMCLKFKIFIVVCSRFSKLTFLKNYFRNTIRVSNGLDPDQDQHSVSPNVGSNCLQRLSVFAFTS